MNVHEIRGGDGAGTQFLVLDWIVSVEVRSGYDGWGVWVRPLLGEAFVVATWYAPSSAGGPPDYLQKQALSKAQAEEYAQELAQLLRYDAPSPRIVRSNA